MWHLNYCVQTKTNLKCINAYDGHENTKIVICAFQAVAQKLL